MGMRGVEGTGRGEGEGGGERASWASVPNKPTVSVDVKQHSAKCGYNRGQELSVKVEVTVLGSRP